MIQDLLIGLDFGTDSVRALLVSADGKEIAQSICPYPRWNEGRYCDPASSQFRQHPQDYLESMEYVLKAVLKECDPAYIRGIGVDTTGSTPCATDASGTPLALLPEFSENPNAMFILWKDHTATAEAARINEVAKNWKDIDYTAYSGGTYSCEWFWSKVLYVLKNDPDVRRSAVRFVEHCDWITALLSGTVGKVGRCAAGHKALWHQSWGGLPSDSFFTSVDPLLAGVRDRLYTKTFTADIPVGKLSPQWAAKLGLSHDVVISGGLLDCHAGAVGAGIKPGEMIKVIGTSTCDITVTAQQTQCIPGICGQVDGSVLPGFTGLEAGQSAFGDIYAWYQKLLSYTGNPASLVQLEQEAMALEDSSVMALDWLNGRRTPNANPYLQGALFGLHLGVTAPMIYRALVESTVFGSRTIFEHFIRSGIEIRKIRALGGIAKKSPFVMQFCADALNMPIQIVKSEQTCALGSAMFASVAAGVHQNTATAVSAMESGCNMLYTPKKNYDARYHMYLRHAKAMEREVTR